jgi:ribosomal protein S18 acetylase RimI-like enzyme
LSPPDRVTVRRATGSDLDAVLEGLWSVAAEGKWVGTEVPFDRTERRRRFERMIDEPNGIVLVAEVDGRIVGHLAMEITGYGVADLGMAIIDGYRGRGVGSALLGSALDWATDHGAHKAWLEVWPHNDPAIALYRKFGFAEEGRKRRHYRRANGEIWDSVLMGKQL